MRPVIVLLFLFLQKSVANNENTRDIGDPKKFPVMQLPVRVQTQAKSEGNNQLQIKEVYTDPKSNNGDDPNKSAKSLVSEDAWQATISYGCKKLQQLYDAFKESDEEGVMLLAESIKLAKDYACEYNRIPKKKSESSSTDALKDINIVVTFVSNSTVTNSTINASTGRN